MTGEMVEHYREGLSVEARDAAPLMVANAADTGGRVLFSQQRGHLWLRQEWEFRRPLVEGVEYLVEGRIADVYPRRDRTILLSETIIREPGSGAIVSVQRHHQSFLLDQPTEEVTLREPGAKEGARGFAIPTGRVLGEIERTVTLEMCGQFFHGSRSYHSNAEQSRELGFRDVVVGGRMTMGYVGELLEAALGERWTSSGDLLVKFTNVLWPDEAIRVRALALDEPGEDGRERVFASVEKADGTVVLVAEGGCAR